MSPRGCRTCGAYVQGLRRHARAPPRAALREVCPLALGQGEVEVAEMALEGPAVVHLLVEGGARFAHPLQHEAPLLAVLGHMRAALPAHSRVRPGTEHNRPY